jgi:hypothetical protein
MEYGKVGRGSTRHASSEHDSIMLRLPLTCLFHVILRDIFDLYTIV